MYITENKVVEYAISLIGQREKKGNSGFKNLWFEKRLKLMGWRKYDPWCAYTAEAIWKYPYERIMAHDVVERFDKLFSASAVKTYKNFKKAGYETGFKPVLGALAVWQVYKDGKPDWRGHIGVVVDVSNAFEYHTVEGNTNNDGSREGVIVAKKEHSVYMEKDKNNGLRFIGFVYLQDLAFTTTKKKLRANEY